MNNLSFNLIVTHEPSYANYKWALDQLKNILEKFNIVDVSQSRIILRVSDPYEAVEKIIEKLPKDTPILRVIPVDIVIEPYVEDVAEIVWKYYTKIPPNATFRITLEGRHLYWRNNKIAHTDEAIRYIASKINRKVDLRNYEWEIYIRVLKIHKHVEVASITIAPAKYIFSKAKR